MKDMKDGIQKQLFRRFGKRFPRGTILFKEGESEREMYIIQSGKVKITRSKEDVDQSLAVLSNGEFFGEMAILTDSCRSATAEVIEDSDILIIKPETFEILIQESSDIAIKMLRKLARRLQESD